MVSPTSLLPALNTHTDGLARCWWCGDDPIYVAYHDDEWGRKNFDDQALFEKLCLEGFQAGLSWITVLRRREALRTAFADFDVQRLAQFTGRDVDTILANPNIIRHRGKIDAVIHNARCVLDLWAGGISLSELVWQFAPKRPQTAPHTRDQIPTTTDEAVGLARALRSYGWKFIGPTSAYAFMQSMGLVNDHIADCAFRRADAAR